MPSTQWKLPLPPRYKTSMTISNAGFVAGGTASTFFEVGFNSLQNPFQALSAIPGNALPLGNDPIGYSQLVDLDSYTKYRVYASKMTIDMAIQDPADQIGVCIIPADAGITPATYESLIQKPLAEHKVFSSQSDDKTITSYKQITTVAGVKRQAIEYDLSNQYNGTVSAVPLQNYTWYVRIKPFNLDKQYTKTGYEGLQGVIKDIDQNLPWPITVFFPCKDNQFIFQDYELEYNTPITKEDLL